MPLESTISLLERLALLVANKERPLADSDYECPVSEFSDPVRHQAEVSRLFRQAPIIIGHASQLPSPGDFLTHFETGVPILVTRNRSSRIQAFVNVCRHRGAVVTTQKEGTAKAAFRCPYHAWVYDLDGRLASVPGREAFPHCSGETHSLVPLPTATRHGFIFVRAAPGEPIDCRSFLGDVDDQFAEFGVGRLHHYRTDEIAAPFNWKIAVDGGLETYHLPTVHPATLNSLYSAHCTDFEAFGRHARISVPKRTIAEIKAVDKQRWNALDQVLLSYFIFPNTILLIANDHMIRFSAFPRDVGHSVILNSVYVLEPAGARPSEEHWKKCADYSRRIITEDFTVNETMQLALSSRANTSYVFGRLEPGLAHFHTRINEALAAAPHAEAKRETGISA